MKTEVKKISTDVAIIGGGTAGLNSAMAAAERPQVLVADKRIERERERSPGHRPLSRFLKPGSHGHQESYLTDGSPRYPGLPT
jgi:glycine/D-amino acid oxidase-like deaminating enzyme